jgi:hypothetical protein
MAYYFGKALTYNFYAISERSPVALSAVTDAPAIYVYKHGYKPTREDAIAGTDNGGRLQSIVTWSDITNGKSFTIASISDPDPTSAQEEYTYWLALNFKLVNSGQVQTHVRALPMRRIDVHHKAITTAQADLEAIFPTIDTYVSSTNQDSAIATASTRAKLDLEAYGFEWAELWRPDLLSEAVTYKALSQLMYSLIREPGDAWQELGKEYNGAYRAILDNLKLEFIATQDGSPADNAPVRVSSGAIRVIR